MGLAGHRSEGSQDLANTSDGADQCKWGCMAASRSQGLTVASEGFAKVLANGNGGLGLLAMAVSHI